MFKFVVDGVWRCSGEFPTESDPQGNVNNWRIPAQEPWYKATNTNGNIKSNIESNDKVAGKDSNAQKTVGINSVNQKKTGPTKA